MSAIFSEVKLPAGESSLTMKASRRSRAALGEAVTIALDSIWSHKMRSILTLVGIIIGVASVVVVGGAIEGLGSYVTTRLTSSFGSNTFMLSRITRQRVSGKSGRDSTSASVSMRMICRRLKTGVKTVKP